MTRVIFAVSAAVVAVALVGAQESQRPTFRAGTQTVSLYATVSDRTGRLVTDLTKDDFDVFDNGVRQPLSVFANVLQPITIVIMLDRSGSMERNFDLERDAAEQFVLGLLPADRAKLGSFSVRVQIDPPEFTSDQQQLIDILHQSLQPAGPTPLWNATAAAMTALEHEDGRRVVLVFTDGIDSPGRVGGNVSFAQVRDRTESEGIMFYGVGLADACVRPTGPATAPTSPPPVSAPRFQGRGIPDPGGRGPGGHGFPGGRGPGMGGPGGQPPIQFPPVGRGSFPAPGRGGDRIDRPTFPLPTGDEGVPRTCVGGKPDPDLKGLADQAGGGYFELTNTADLRSTFLRIADELHHQYLMAFTAQTLDGKVHQLEVKVRQPALVARARKSYLASAEN